MATGGFKKHKPPQGLPAGVKPQSLVRHRTLARLLKPLYKALGLSVDGLDLMETADGVHLRALGGAGAGDAPFAVIIHNNGDGTGYMTVNPGTCLRGMATTMAGDLLTADPPPQVSLSLSGTAKVWVQINTTLTLDVAGLFVVHWELDSSEIHGGSSVPDDDYAAGVYYVEIATITDGKVTGARTGHIYGDLTNSGLGNGEAYLQLA
jgi:hypothetical protein